MLQLVESGGMDRRSFLRIGSLGLGSALTLPALLAARNVQGQQSSPMTTGKSVIFLFQHGGPSQFETFDPKPNAPDSIRTVGGVINTSVPGITFGATFERLAHHAHRLALVRSFQSGDGNHDIKPIVSRDSLNANIGSIYARLVGPMRPSGMPTNAAIFPNAVAPQEPGPSNTFGNFASSGGLGGSFAPFVPGTGGQLQRDMTLQVSRSRLDDRRVLLQELDALRRDVDNTGELQTMDRFRAQAFDVILGGVASAFDLSREDPRTVARYDTRHLDRPQSWEHKNNKRHYAAHARSLGKLLLLARRLVEAGCGFVTINTAFVWDMHSDVNNLPVREGIELVGRPLDHALSAFIDDIEARGLSDRILLVVTGEMGRTPRINGQGGRDHWGRLTPLLVYGAGVTHGQVIGCSTPDGGQPATTPQTNRNLIGTIMHTVFNVTNVRLAQGIPADVSRLVTDYQPIPGLEG